MDIADTEFTGGDDGAAWGRGGGFLDDDGGFGLMGSQFDRGAFGGD